MLNEVDGVARFPTAKTVNVIAINPTGRLCIGVPETGNHPATIDSHSMTFEDVSSRQR
jgi:hypothetical protein